MRGRWVSINVVVEERREQEPGRSGTKFRTDGGGVADSGCVHLVNVDQRVSKECAQEDEYPRGYRRCEWTGRERSSAFLGPGPECHL